jgi:hypothetical protein
MHKEAMNINRLKEKESGNTVSSPGKGALVEGKF